MYNQYRKRTRPANWEQYRLQHNLTVKIRRDAIKAYFNDTCAEGAKNTNFWPTVKPFLTNKGAGGKSTIMVRVNDTIITDFSFRHPTPKEVEQIMQSLDTKKATGPDRIPAKLIKPAAGPLSHQLTKVFNQCVDNNEFPSDAKLAEVVPVHKKTTT